MFKSVAALSAALIAGMAIVASATDANAGHRRHGCCGPIAPVYTSSTKKVYKNVTHYRDVHRTKYVQRIQRIVHITRIQPIIHVHNVTRVHTRIVGVVHRVHQREVQYLPPKRYVTSSVVHLRPHCDCPPCRRY